MLTSFASGAENNITPDFLAPEEEKDPQITVVLAPQTRATISAEVAGKITALKKDFGQHFNKGDILLQLDDNYYKRSYGKTSAIYNLARANIASAELVYKSKANLKKNEAEILLARTRLNALKKLQANKIQEKKVQAVIDVAKKNLEATEKLYKDKMASNMDLENAQKDLIVAKANLELIQSSEKNEIAGAERALAIAQAEYVISKAHIEPNFENARKELSLAESNLNIAERELKNCQIQAPFTGRVVKVLINEHELVQKGTQLLEIVNDSVLRAKFLLPSAYFKKVKKGQKVRVNIVETGQITKAVVSHISAVIDPASESFMVYAEVDNAEGLLRVGMRGRFKLSDIEIK
jgi:multidrug resistance efflux pump